MLESPSSLTLDVREDIPCAHVGLRRGHAVDVLTPVFGTAVPDRPLATNAGAATVIGLGPRQWLTWHADAARLSEALAGVADVTDLTGARTLFTIAGPGVRRVLASVVPIDLHPRAFPGNAAAQTWAAYIGVLIWRAPGHDAYHLSVLRSYGAAFQHVITDAMETPR